jgi:hypothetical protein
MNCALTMLKRRSILAMMVSELPRDTAQAPSW